MMVGDFRWPILSGVLPAAIPGIGEPSLPWKACCGAWQDWQAMPRGSERFVSSKMRLPSNCASLSPFSSSDTMAGEGAVSAAKLGAGAGVSQGHGSLPLSLTGGVWAGRPPHAYPSAAEVDNATGAI